MRVVVTIDDAIDSPARLDQVRFHHALGADAVVLPEAPGGSGDRLRDLALAEHSPDWLLEAGPGEFWYPRGEDLHDALAPIPPRYTIVQALVRDFLPGPVAETPVAERTVRTSLLEPGVPTPAASEALRPAYRVLDGKIDPSRGDVPLRAWYPLELLRFTRDLGTATTRHTVVDERLRDALATAAGDPDATLMLPVPTVVDDSLYAIECAAVKEVDLAALDRHIRELERRIAWLEERPLAKVVRGLKRLLRR